MEIFNDVHQFSTWKLFMRKGAVKLYDTLSLNIKELVTFFLLKTVLSIYKTNLLNITVFGLAFLNEKLEKAS